jgi:hypothetical protein
VSVKSDREIVKRVNTTRRLLAEFGLRAYAYDPGVLCKDASGATVDLDGAIWRWVEPLLKELRRYRAAPPSASLRAEEEKK